MQRRISTRTVRALFGLVAVAALSGCGTFPLASSITPLSAKTREQQQLDTLTCKDQAKLAVNTAERQAGNFMLGMTLVGVPLAYELDKKKQREVFKECMEARGYRVVPPDDSATVAAPATPPAAPPAPVLAPAPALAPAQTAPTPVAVPSVAQGQPRDEAAQLLKLKELRDKGLISEQEHERKRKEILDRL